jgi:uncharacterized protein YdhG (YjbR/CyaY superfamily)
MENKPADIDQYISSFPEPVQLILEQMRGIVHVALPQAVESISYGMPTFWANGHPVISFAAWKKHVSLYAVPVLDPELEQEVAPYRAEKDTLRFSLAKPVPYALIERVVAALVERRASGPRPKSEATRKR